LEKERFFRQKGKNIKRILIKLKMKILIVHRYFWPDSPNCGKILHALAEHFVQEGRFVDIITGQPSYSHDSATSSSTTEECVEGLRIKRLRLRTETNSLMWRVLNAFYIALVIVFRSLVKRYDVIIGTSIPPVLGAFSCALVSKITGARFIYYCMDIHPEIGRLSGDVSNRFLYKILQRLDNWSCIHADPVLVHSQDMRKTILSRPNGDKIHVDIMNNFALDESASNSSKRKRPRLTKKKAGLKMVFAGNLGRFQNLWQLMGAMSLITHRQDIELFFLGSGMLKEQLIFNQINTNSNIKFLGHQPLEIVYEAIRDADVCLVTLGKGIYKYAYPGKTMSYLKQGKPIIATVELKSELARDIIGKGYGFVVPHDDERCLADLFLKIADDLAWCNAMGRAAKKVYRKQFSSKVALERWSILLDRRH
jgi:glycosyltransferase involved in cell wall biosynthesis